MKAVTSSQLFEALPSGAARNAVRSLSDNPSSPTQPTTGNVMALDLQPGESAEIVREMMYRRYTAPFTDTIPYHRCGICE